MQTTWFWIIAAFWSLYFVTEGFDFGVGMLLPIVGRSDEDRGTMLRAIGPIWDGNEVWLIIVGAATFAAFPVWYATMFSGLYIALLLLLVLLIVRIVSFEWRGKSDSPRWRSAWTWINTIASVGIPLLWGIALTSLLHGLPISSSQEFTGSFWSLFTPYTVVAGLTLVVLFAFHGATFVSLRTVGDLNERAVRTSARLGPPAFLGTVVFLAWTVAVGIDQNDKSAFPGVLVAAVALASAGAALLFVHRRREGRAFVATSLTIVSAVALLFTELYPRVMVSSTDFSNSLTTTNASSSHYSLVAISIFALVLVPIILVYQAWSYRVFKVRLGRAAPVSSPIEMLGPRTTDPAPDA